MLRGKERTISFEDFHYTGKVRIEREENQQSCLVKIT